MSKMNKTQLYYAQLKAALNGVDLILSKKHKRADVSKTQALLGLATCQAAPCGFYDRDADRLLFIRSALSFEVSQSDVRTCTKFVEELRKNIPEGTQPLPDGPGPNPVMCLKTRHQQYIDSL